MISDSAARLKVDHGAGNPQTVKVADHEGEACSGAKRLKHPVEVEAPAPLSEQIAQLPKQAEQPRIEQGIASGVGLDPVHLEHLPYRVVSHGSGEIRDDPRKPTDEDDAEVDEEPLSKDNAEGRLLFRRAALRIEPREEERERKVSDEGDHDKRCEGDRDGPRILDKRREGIGGLEGIAHNREDGDQAGGCESERIEGQFFGKMHVIPVPFIMKAIRPLSQLSVSPWQSDGSQGNAFVL